MHYFLLSHLIFSLSLRSLRERGDREFKQDSFAQLAPLSAAYRGGECAHGGSLPRHAYRKTVIIIIISMTSLSSTASYKIGLYQSVVNGDLTLIVFSHRYFTRIVIEFLVNQVIIKKSNLSPRNENLLYSLMLF